MTSGKPWWHSEDFSELEEVPVCSTDPDLKTAAPTTSPKFETSLAAVGCLMAPLALDPRPALSGLGGTSRRHDRENRPVVAITMLRNTFHHFGHLYRNR